MSGEDIPMRNAWITLIVLLLLLGCPKQERRSSVQLEPAGQTLRKSPIDPRAYDAFVLDNGMKVLVISDPETDMAAATLHVQVGSFSDPWDRQGLAHFLEHMLLMGTEKYPDADEYRRFIEGHGGQANASSGKESTRYFFSLDQEYLEPALDRFSQFFIAPKLDPDYVQRERNAVHSEYSLNLKNNGRRNLEVSRKVANPAHPFSKFSVGDLKTLADRDNDPVLDDLRGFYDAEYSASRMSLAVIGREDVTELRSLVHSKFSEVRTNGKRSGAVEEARPPVFLPEHLGVQINIEPLADLRTMTLQFLLPPGEDHFRAHPVGILLFLLGHEGEGSLFSLLKRRGWVESLVAKDWGGADDYDLLEVEIGLTEEGFANHNQVMESFFQYVRLISEEEDLSRYFDEKKQIAHLNFLHTEPPAPLRSVQVASQLMTYYPLEHVVDFFSVYGEYDDALLRTYLAELTPSKVRAILVGPGLETDQVEPIYGASYSVRALDSELIRSWLESPLDAALVLPAPNPYIPRQTALKPGSTGEFPVLLKDTPGLKVWHLHDTSFGVPRATVRVNLHSPLVLQSLHNRVCKSLFSALLTESLSEFSYPLGKAGMSVSVSSFWKGLRLTVSGYDEKQQELLTDLSNRVRSFDIDPDRFALEKARLVRDKRNLKTSRPLNQGNVKTWQFLNPLYDDTDASADALEKLSIEEFEVFVDQWFEELSVQMLIHGNQTREDASRLAEVAEKAFLSDAKPVDWPGTTIRRIPAGELIQDIELDHPDSVFIAVYQGGETTDAAQARYKLLGELMRTDFFNEIRTQQQLGYRVQAFYNQIDRVPGVRMIIQSSTAGPAVLQERVDAFLASQRDKIAAMSDEEYETLKQGLVAKMEEKDSSLSDSTRTLLVDLANGYTSFDHEARLLTEMRLLGKEEILALYEKVFLSEERGRILVRGTGTAHLDEAPAQPCFSEDCVMPKLIESISRGN